MSKLSSSAARLFGVALFTIALTTFAKLVGVDGRKVEITFSLRYSCAGDREGSGGDLAATGTGTSAVLSGRFTLSLCFTIHVFFIVVVHFLFNSTIPLGFKFQ